MRAVVVGDSTNGQNCCLCIFTACHQTFPLSGRLSDMDILDMAAQQPGGRGLKGTEGTLHGHGGEKGKVGERRTKKRKKEKKKKKKLSPTIPQ